MKKFFQRMFHPVLLLSCLALGACSQEKSQAPETGVLTVTDSTFKNEVTNSDLPVLVDFWATWCGPCRMYGPVVDQVAGDYKGRLKVARADVDQSPGLSQTYQITAIPLSILFQNGNVVKKWVGYMSKEDLKAELEKILPPVQNPAPSHS